jgi:class 3 adenylate cyclase/CHASE3 domain sensor protein
MMGAIKLFGPLVTLVARLRVSVHTKLRTGFFLIAVLLLGTSAAGYVMMQRATADGRQLASLADRVAEATRLEYIVTASMHFRAMHLLTGDPANDTKLVKARQDFTKLVATMEASANEAEKSVFAKIHEVNLKFGASQQQVDIFAHRPDGAREAMKIHLEEEHPISHQLEGLARDLQRSAKERRDASLSFAERNNRLSQWFLTGVGAASILLALFLGYVLSWPVLDPIQKLDEHLDHVTRGDLQHTVLVANRDEFERLAAKANQMTRVLAEARLELEREHASVQAQARQLEEINRSLEERVQSHVVELEQTRRLSSYLAPQVVKAITSGQSTFAMATARKQLTMVFADIRGFTAFSDVAEPEEVIGFLNAYLSKLTDLVFKYEGTLDKFLGDGMLVFFNDPVPQPDHAKRAVQMALDMGQRAREMRKEWHIGDSPLDLGIGISTGYVTVGTIGSEHRMEYTVIGQQVNLAARLVAVAEPGQIIISQRTYDMVRDLVEVSEVGPLTVKGFQQPVVAYNVLGVKGTR